jgi:CDP-paratose 2-epimerase
MKICVSGCNGLVGSCVTDRFASQGHAVVGLDNDGRAEFFGPDGSTRQTGRWLCERHGLNFKLHGIDVRDTPSVFELFEREGPFDAVVHCAAQPAHDWAAQRPLDDFHINAFGTLKMLEACRQRSPEAVFILLSTNKIYGVDLGPVVERETRFELADWPEGISEDFPVGRSSVSIYGASKLAADTCATEFGRYYAMPTVCLRAGCLTGAGHAAVPLHGFLSYLVKCNVSRETYVVRGYGGKQVRDNLHARDLARLIEMMVAKPPKPGTVYNVGGGRANSCSILEAFEAVEGITGRPMLAEFDHEPRRGDHACYYSDMRRVQAAYPEWRVERDLPSIYRELVEDWRDRG